MEIERMNLTPLLLGAIVIAIVICTIVIVNALNGLKPNGKSEGLLQQLVGLMTKPTKQVPSWIQFPGWKRPAVDWAHWQKLLQEAKIDWKTFNWHSWRTGEMYVDGGTGAGEPNIAHPSLKIGPKSGPLGIACAVGFTNPSEGHTTLLNVISPCVQTRPDGIVVTEVTIKNMGQAIVMAGPVQSAFADAVTDCIRAGFLPNDMDALQDLCWIGQGFAYPFADNHERVYYNNYVAVTLCIIKAVLGLPTAEEVLASTADHPFRGTVLENRGGASRDTGTSVARAPKPKPLTESAA